MIKILCANNIYKSAGLICQHFIYFFAAPLLIKPMDFLLVLALNNNISTNAVVIVLLELHR